MRTVAALASFVLLAGCSSQATPSVSPSVVSATPTVTQTSASATPSSPHPSTGATTKRATVAPPATAAPTAWKLTLKGLGPIALGDTMKAAEATGLASYDPKECTPEGLWVLRSTTGPTLNAGVVLATPEQYAKIAAIQVDDPAILTDDGLRVGSTKAQLIAAWGAASHRTASDTVQAEVYAKGGEGGYLIAEIPKGGSSIGLFTLVPEGTMIQSYFAMDNIYCFGD